MDIFMLVIDTEDGEFPYVLSAHRTIEQARKALAEYNEEEGGEVYDEDSVGSEDDEFRWKCQIQKGQLSD